jgi:pimeloyl-ACP methyl ester carboxylesterase
MTNATPTSHTVKLGGLHCRYLQWGDDERPPLLLLHGLRSYAHTWDPIAAALSTSHRIIAPDFRGRGDSDWDPDGNYFTAAYVSDIEDLVGLLGLTGFGIVGHSMGGTVGYVYAARHPDQVAALVVEDIGPGSSTTTDGADRIVREMLSTPTGFESLATARAYWRRIRPTITEEALTSRIEHTLRPGENGRWEWKLDMAGIATARLAGDPTAVHLWACVEALQCPTLVIRGAKSDFLSASTCEDMAARQAHLTWVEIPDAGHYVHDDNPADYLRALEQAVRPGAS